MAIIRLSDNDFLRLGLRHSGFSNKTIDHVRNTTNVVRFMDKFYVTPQTCSKIFDDVQLIENCGDDAIQKAKPLYLLMALCYLKKYPTKHELAGFADCCEDTALAQSKRYAKAITALQSKKIKWLFDDPSLNETFIVSVDGVHCRIFEPALSGFSVA